MNQQQSRWTPSKTPLRTFSISLLCGAASLAIATTTATTAAAQPPLMRVFDARLAINDGTAVEPSATQRTALWELRREIPNLTVDFDVTTGVARSVRNPIGHLSSPQPGSEARLVALDFISQHRTLLGLGEEDLAAFEISDIVYSKASGTTHLHLRQTWGGIPVYQGQIRISVDHQGRVISLHNAFLPEIAAAVGPQLPALSAAKAVAIVGKDFGFSNLPVEIIENGEGPRAHTRIQRPEISRQEINARLFWLPIRRGAARLVWNFQIATHDMQHYFDLNVDATTGKIWTRFDQVSDAQYRVYAPPVESPQHTTPLPPSDARTVEVDPHDINASPLGWHDTGSASYTILRGNNAYAFEDSDGNGIPSAPEPDCGGSLDCDFPLDLSGSASNYAAAAATNAFYLTNFFHDVQYAYGFDEGAGNFQQNNFANGGVGGDPIDIHIHNSGCNGIFGAPPDGSKGILDLFLCGSQDGAYDNGVTLHELGHSINRRQVGGPSTNCLANQQRPDEGWSDWFALVYTAETGDQGTDVRGIGSWLTGDVPTGTIRTQAYSTDPAINTHTYESISGLSVPHGVGSVWTQALWEVYWALVDTHGFDADLANLGANAGNHRALHYVTEGQKLTPCSPSFVDARDGIVQAAASLNGGADVCILWEAFAAFGLGTDAVSGGSNSTNPTNGYAVPPECGSGNAVPQVTILSPGDGSSSTVGDSVTFTATASDVEDGDLSGNLSWSSSLDGTIGSGASFSTTSLSVGTHSIVAAVTDSGGLAGSDTVQITVNGICLPKGASCTSNSQCCSNRCKGGGNKTCK
jgi:extracellular elastinolytic metalloproteinase